MIAKPKNQLYRNISAYFDLILNVDSDAMQRIYVFPKQQFAWPPFYPTVFQPYSLCEKGDKNCNEEN